MLAAGPLGTLVASRDPERGLTVLVLFASALVIWLGALARIGAIVHAPLWAAPLHLAGSWLVANVFAEGASDVLSNKPTRWGGREYGLPAEQAKA
jgi:hypothetical protein